MGEPGPSYAQELEVVTGNVYQVVDIADPADAREVGRWWLPGQWKVGGESGAASHTSLHGGAYVVGDRAYLPYGGRPRHPRHR